MGKLKECSACGNQVSKSAKTCPHCGQDLKGASLFESLMGLIIIIAVIAYFMPTKEETEQKLQESIQNIVYAKPFNISPRGQLKDAFTVMSDYTDLQRETLEKELEGKIVRWNLIVYDIDEKGDNKFEISSHGIGQVPTDVIVYTRTEQERSFLLSLKTEDIVPIKGIITGTFMRRIQIEPAILVMN